MFVGHGEEGQVPGERRRRRGRVGGVGGGESKMEQARRDNAHCWSDRSLKLFNSR